HPLTGPFDQPTPSKRFGKAPIARILFVENVIDGDPRRKATGTDHLESSGELTDEDGSAQSIVSVAECIEDSLSDNGFVESHHLCPEEAVLITLPVVAEVDSLPELIMNEKKALAILGTVLGWACGLGRAILEDDLGLGDEARERGPGTEQEHGSVREGTVSKELGVAEGLLVRPRFDPRIA